MSITITSFALAAALQARVGEVNNWTLFRGDGYCAAATTYGRDMNVFVRHDVANDDAVLSLSRPVWRAVEEGRSYNLRIDLSNGRYYEGMPNRGTVMSDDGNRRGVMMSLDGDEFLADFAAANWMEVRLDGVLLASLTLRGTREVMQQVSNCSARAFREDIRDPFERIPPAPAPSTRPDRAAQLRSGSISDADYPAAAIRTRAQGATTITMQISAEGRVTGCSVTGSSGNSALDSTSCSLAQRRFRYSPEVRNGQLVATTRTHQITWRLPEDAPDAPIEGPTNPKVAAPQALHPGQPPASQ